MSLQLLTDASPLKTFIYMQDSALRVISAHSRYKQTYALSVMRFSFFQELQSLIFAIMEYLSSKCPLEIPLYFTCRPLS